MGLTYKALEVYGRSLPRLRGALWVLDPTCTVSPRCGDLFVSALTGVLQRL